MSIIFGAARGISKLAETVSNTTNEADRNEKTNATSENKNCLKKVIITEECMACGLCLGKSDLIVESEDGRVKCSKQFVSESDAKVIAEIASECLENAIKIVDTDMVICDINEFFEIANKKKDQLFSCQLNTLEFNPADYVINAPDFQIRSDPRGVSRDYDRTDRDGFNYFKYNVFPHTKTIVRNMVAEYKNKVLSKVFDLRNGGKAFYLKMNEQMSNELKDLAIYCKTVFGVELDIQEFSKVDILPYTGNKDIDELYGYRLQHLEEIYIIDDIVSNMEAEDYEFSVTIEDSPYDTDKYTWCISSLMLKYYQDIRDEISKYINRVDSPIKEISMDLIEPHKKKLSDLWDKKIKELESIMPSN